MPVLVTVKFAKDSQHAKVDAELAPATIGQIAKAANLLHATQSKHWLPGEKSWKWEVMSIPKADLKGEVKEIMSLMKSNPVFVRVAPSNVASKTAATATKEEGEIRDSSNFQDIDEGEHDQILQSKVQDGSAQKKANENGKERIEGHREKVAEVRGTGGVSGLLIGLVRKVLG